MNASALARQDSLTLTELAVELERRQETKHDLTVDTRRIGWYSGVSAEDEHLDGTHVTIDGAEEIQPVGGWKVNDHAHGQISDRLGIPKRYYDRLRTDAPGLLDTNVRHWLTDKPETRMVRTLDGNVRAFLSDRYRRLDDFNLMQHILPVFSEIPGLKFHVAALTDTKLHLRAILPGIERAIKVGDSVQAGIEIKNSEVGSGALTVAPYVWRLICLNGMVMPSAVRRYHVGKRVEDDDPNLALYRQETLAKDDAAFFAKVADIVRGTLTEARFDEIVEQLRQTITGEKIAAPVAATTILGKAYDLGEGEQQSIIARLAEGGDLSQWGMVNAITASAKDAPGWDRVAELEAVGGKVASMTSTEWERVAVAA